MFADRYDRDGRKQNNDTKFTEKISTTKNRRKKISLL